MSPFVYQVTPANATFSPDGKYMLSYCANNEIKLWDCKDAKLLKNCYSNKNHRKIVFSANGKYFADLADLLSIYETTTLCKIFEQEINDNTFIYFSPNSNNLYFYDKEESLVNYNIDNRKLDIVEVSHEIDYISPLFLYSVSVYCGYNEDNGVVYVYDNANNCLLTRILLPGDYNLVRDVIITNQDNTIVINTSYGIGIIHIEDIKSKLINLESSNDNYIEHDYTQLTVLNNNILTVAGGTVYLWDIQEGSIIKRYDLTANLDRIDALQDTYNVLLHPDGKSWLCYDCGASDYFELRNITDGNISRIYGSSLNSVHKAQG